jgi:hypothetical protein
MLPHGRTDRDASDQGDEHDRADREGPSWLLRCARDHELGRSSL